MTQDEQLAQARCHVESGRRIVERQRVLANRLNTESSADLLALFEHTQQIFEADLAKLLDRK
jgi:hypothetical protein